MPRRLRYSKRAFLRRGVFAASIKFGGLLCVFALQILLARLMDDTSQYGKYAWGQSLLFLIGTLCCMGLPMTASRFIASLDAQHHGDAARAITRATVRLLGRITTLPVFAALALWLAWPGLGDSRYGPVATAALLFTPALTFAMLFRDIARAQQWLALALVPLQLARPLITAALAVTSAVLLDIQLTGLLALCLAGASILLVMLVQSGIYALRQRSVHNHEADTPVPFEYTPERLVPTAKPLFVTRCAELTITYSNVLLVGFLAGPAAAGAYFAAERLAQLATIPKTVMSIINQQPMAAAHATSRQRDLQLLATQSAHGSLWPTLLISGALAMFAAPLLHMFGRDFTAAAPVLIALMVAGVINVFTGPAQDILIMTGRQQRIPVVVISAAFVHIAALLLLLPAYGAVGAAVASIVSACVMRFWLMWLAKREAGIRTTVLAGLGAKS